MWKDAIYYFCRDLFLLLFIIVELLFCKLLNAVVSPLWKFRGASNSFIQLDVAACELSNHFFRSCAIILSFWKVMVLKLWMCSKVSFVSDGGKTKKNRERKNHHVPFDKNHLETKETRQTNSVGTVVFFVLKNFAKDDNSHTHICQNTFDSTRKKRSKIDGRCVSNRVLALCSSHTNVFFSPFVFVCFVSVALVKCKTVWRKKTSEADWWYSCSLLLRCFFPLLFHLSNWIRELTRAHAFSASIHIWMGDIHKWVSAWPSQGNSLVVLLDVLSSYSLLSPLFKLKLFVISAEHSDVAVCSRSISNYFSILIPHRIFKFHQQAGDLQQKQCLSLNTWLQIIIIKTMLIINVGAAREYVVHASFERAAVFCNHVGRRCDRYQAATR